MTVAADHVARDAVTHLEPKILVGEYLTTGHFWEATTENWESEFLQMGSFVLLTIFFIQKGSPESKQPGGDDVDEDPRDKASDPDAPWPVRRGGGWLVLYENSLLIAFFGMFFAAIVLFTVVLRQRGSPESKPVAAPHDQTGG